MGVSSYFFCHRLIYFPANFLSYFFFSPDISWITCCDHRYGRPSGRPRVSAPATYRSGTPRNQHPAVARWHAHLCGLATAIHEMSGLGFFTDSRVQEWRDKWQQKKPPLTVQHPSPDISEGQPAYSRGNLPLGKKLETPRNVIPDESAYGRRDPVSSKILLFLDSG